MKLVEVKAILFENFSNLCADESTAAAPVAPKQHGKRNGKAIEDPQLLLLLLQSTVFSFYWQYNQ